MACGDIPIAIFAGTRPGDRITVFVTNCSSQYYLNGDRTVTQADGTKDRVSVQEHQLDEAAPLTYFFQQGEMFDVVLRFNPDVNIVGKSCEVHGRVVSGDGSTLRFDWCTTIVSGTADPDVALFGVK